MDKEDMVKIYTHTHMYICMLLLLSHFSRIRLCDPVDSSSPGSAVAGILQARTLEWVATSFSNAWKWKVKVKSLSHVWLLATPWTAAIHIHTHTHTHTYIYMYTNIHTHNGILLSYKKEWNNVICSNMDATRDYHTKWSKSDKDKCHIISLIYRI